MKNLNQEYQNEKNKEKNEVNYWWLNYNPKIWNIMDSKISAYFYLIVIYLHLFTSYYEY